MAATTAAADRSAPRRRAQPMEIDEAARTARDARDAPDGLAASVDLCLAHSGWTDVRRLTAADVDLRDVAHGLARINRWNGAIREPVSVAWHSLVVAELARRRDPAAGLHGLMHDAAEAYTGDWARPWKCHMSRAAAELAAALEAACLEAAGVEPTAATRAAVGDADDAVMLLEHHRPWGLGQPRRSRDLARIEAAQDAARRWNPCGGPVGAERATAMFTDYALELMTGTGAPMLRRAEAARKRRRTLGTR